jgi:hypothetical protein
MENAIIDSEKGCAMHEYLPKIRAINASMGTSVAQLNPL